MEKEGQPKSHKSSTFTCPQYEGGYELDYQGPVPEVSQTSAATPTYHPADVTQNRSVIRVGRTCSVPSKSSEEQSQRNAARVTRKERIQAERVILEQPLSTMASELGHIPIVDIEAYVKRSADLRRAEVANSKRCKRVKRPMNSFMLYRKAYQGRIRAWSRQSRHQVISQLCGDSWHLEPSHIKDQFLGWAQLERINHQNAHPEYKFLPVKPANLGSRRRKSSLKDSSEWHKAGEFAWEDGETQGLTALPASLPRNFISPGNTTDHYSSVTPLTEYYNSSVQPLHQSQFYLHGEYIQQSADNFFDMYCNEDIYSECFGVGDRELSPLRHCTRNIQHMPTTTNSFWTMNGQSHNSDWSMEERSERQFLADGTQEMLGWKESPEY